MRPKMKRLFSYVLLSATATMLIWLYIPQMTKTNSNYVHYGIVTQKQYGEVPKNLHLLEEKKSDVELNLTNPLDLKAPLPFLSDYRNPCWEESGRIRCLPYFMIIGMMKCGTTDLFNRLLVHPNIISPYNKRWSVEDARLKVYKKERKWLVERWRDKEMQYWSTFMKRNWTLNHYINHFQIAADYITNRTSYDYRHNKHMHKVITVDSSTTTSWRNNNWKKEPRNRNLAQPTILIPHYVKKVLPKEKLILMIRNPTERIYSEFLFFRQHYTVQEKTPEVFHNMVVNEIAQWNSCSKHLRACLYDIDNNSVWGNSVPRGIYQYYIEDWLKVFSPDQFAIVVFEEYKKNPLQIMKKLFRFLEIEALPRALHDIIELMKVENVGKDKKPMNLETKVILDNFYRQSILNLTRFLRSDKILKLWNVNEELMISNDTGPHQSLI